MIWNIEENELINSEGINYIWSITYSAVKYGRL
jgi:hypothetical protein